MNDYEAHLSSYDHTHKQRLKDMKAMVKDPSAGARARKAEAKADGIISLKLTGTETSNNSGGGFKKGGFKKSGFKSAFGSSTAPANPASISAPGSSGPASLVGRFSTEGGKEAATRETRDLDISADTDSEDEGYERYDPRHPTD